MKTFFLFFFVALVVGVGGFVYRSASEHPNQQIACPLDAKVCPDGSAVSRTGESCVFPPCPPPNVTLPSLGISYAVPAGFTEAPFAEGGAVIASYQSQLATSSDPAALIQISAYAVEASSTPLETIQKTALGGATGEPLPATSFTSALFGNNHRFTVVAIDRSEGVVDTAYYFTLGNGSKVIRFDAIDRNVAGWSDPSLSVSSLPAHAALRYLLGTLSGQ